MWKIAALIALIVIICVIFSKKELIYVYSPTCPHCIRFEKEWSRIEMELSSTRKLNSQQAAAIGLKAPHVPYLVKRTQCGPFAYVAAYEGDRRAADILSWYKE